MMSKQIQLMKATTARAMPIPVPTPVACNVVDDCCDTFGEPVGKIAQLEVGARTGSMVGAERSVVVKAEFMFDLVVGGVGSESFSDINRVLVPGPLKRVLPMPDLQQFGLSWQQTSRSLPVKFPQDTSLPVVAVIVLQVSTVS